MLRRRPIPLAGARTFPKHLRFDRMALMDRGVQRTASAIYALVNDLRSWIMSRMSSCCHGSSLGAISVPLLLKERRGTDHVPCST